MNSVAADTSTYATISRPNATWPSTRHAQRRLRIQFGIAPARNATTEHAVVPKPATYITANTIALVVAATSEPSV